MNFRSKTAITEHWAREWTVKDAEFANAVIGDPGSQAVWEAYAMLLAFRQWAPSLAVTEGRVTVCGDALGVLHDAVKLRARDKRLNNIMVELALTIAPYGLEFAALHIWSEWNDVCDELGRGTGLTSAALLRSKRVHPSAD